MHLYDFKKSIFVPTIIYNLSAGYMIAHLTTFAYKVLADLMADVGNPAVM